MVYQDEYLTLFLLLLLCRAAKTNQSEWKNSSSSSLPSLDLLFEHDVHDMLIAPTHSDIHEQSTLERMKFFFFFSFFFASFIAFCFLPLSGLLSSICLSFSIFLVLAKKTVTHSSSLSVSFLWSFAYPFCPSIANRRIVAVARFSFLCLSFSSSSSRTRGEFRWLFLALRCLDDPSSKKNASLSTFVEDVSLLS